jgi:hypothetical protein
MILTEFWLNKFWSLALSSPVHFLVIYLSPSAAGCETSASSAGRNFPPFLLG